MATSDLLTRHPLVQPETRQHSSVANWSEAVEVACGSIDILYISGVTPSVVDAEAPLESVRRFGSMEDQTRTVLRELRALLTRHGYGFDSLVKLTCFLVTRDGGTLDLDGFGRAYREYFDDSNLPSRSRVVVTRLMDPGWLLEIEAVAARRRQPESSSHPVRDALEQVPT